MKAVTCARYGPPDVLERSEVDKPTPKANEVLVRVHAGAITAEDCASREGVPLAARLATG